MVTDLQIWIIRNYSGHIKPRRTPVLSYTTRAFDFWFHCLPKAVLVDLLITTTIKAFYKYCSLRMSIRLIILSSTKCIRGTINVHLVDFLEMRFLKVKWLVSGKHGHGSFGNWQFSLVCLNLTQRLSRDGILPKITS